MKPDVRLVKNFEVTLFEPQDLHKIFGFKVDMYQNHMLDENVIAEISEELLKITRCENMRSSL